MSLRDIWTLPSAAFNRTGVGSQTRGFWDQVVHDFVASQEHKNPKIQLVLRNIRNTAEDKNNLQVTVIGNQNLQGAYDLVIYLTEDGVISPQVDGRLERQGLDPNILDYVHNHMLRTSVGPASGNPFLEDGLGQGERLAVDFDVLPGDRQPEWVADQMTFVVFVIERSTGLVVQSETVPFTKD